ncbi:hypothetical protein DFH09DRAFT_177231 [Mycena vulgaris]|nr:hypothetical protein DFH09DRAFT_177231 [Mycena vulgaris]
MSLLTSNHPSGPSAPHMGNATAITETTNTVSCTVNATATSTTTNTMTFGNKTTTSTDTPIPVPIPTDVVVATEVDAAGTGDDTSTSMNTKGTEDAIPPPVVSSILPKSIASVDISNKVVVPPTSDSQVGNVTATSTSTNTVTFGNFTSTSTGAGAPSRPEPDSTPLPPAYMGDATAKTTTTNTVRNATSLDNALRSLGLLVVTDGKRSTAIPRHSDYHEAQESVRQTATFRFLGQTEFYFAAPYAEESALCEIPADRWSDVIGSLQKVHLVLFEASKLSG